LGQFPEELKLKRQGVWSQAGDRRLEAIGLENMGDSHVPVPRKSVPVEDSGLRPPVFSLAPDFRRVGPVQIAVLFSLSKEG
jgi:hypothetical protein